MYSNEHYSLDIKTRSRLAGASLVDKLGILTSGGCIVHCLLVPVLILLTPGLVSEALENENIHILLACAALFFVTIAVARGYQLHKSYWPLVLGSGGLSLIWGSLLVEDPEWLEQLFTTVGALSTATAHILNHRFARRAADHNQNNK